MEEILDDYKSYRRIYPKLRLSWSLYKYWVSNDWEGVWRYLTEREHYSNRSMQRGKQVHEFLESKPLLPAIAKVIAPGFDVEVKGYAERKMEIEGDYYVVVIKPDFLSKYYVVDYKHGSLKGYEPQIKMYCCFSGRTKGLLAQIDADRDEKGEVTDVRVKRTQKYDFTKKDLKEWELRMETMAESILHQIQEGRLDEYIRYFMF